MNFATSGFVKDGEIVTCVSMISLILCTEDIQILYTQGIIYNPKSYARYYFNYSNGWIPISLCKAIPVKYIDSVSDKKYVLLYFTSHYQLPFEIKEKIIFSSPIGILSLPLYLNQRHPVIIYNQVNNQCKLIKFSSFPGSEGAYCDGDIIIPSKYQGYSIAYQLPKL